jgi:hypothetical protein
MAPTEEDPIVMLADRIIKLNARIAALQSLLTEEQNTEYSRLVEQYEQISLQSPEELAWKRALRQRPSGGRVHD